MKIDGNYDVYNDYLEPKKIKISYIDRFIKATVKTGILDIYKIKANFHLIESRFNRFELYASDSNITDYYILVDIKNNYYTYTIDNIIDSLKDYTEAIWYTM